jgi:uncharacterized coiled-coil protein SlyX
VEARVAKLEAIVAAQTAELTGLRAQLNQSATPT